MDKLIYSIYFLIVLLSVWGPLPNFYGALIIVLLFTITLFFDRNFIYLTPSITVPFLFLFRAKDFSNFFVAGITEILMFFSISFYIISFINSKNSNKKFLLSLPAFLILLHLVYTTLNSIIYLNSITLFLVFIRIYLVPLIFLIVIINVASKNPYLMIRALKFFIYGTFIVASISLLQYFDFIKIPTDNSVLGKYVTSTVGDFDINNQIIIPERNLLGSLIPRLNILLGGAVGSVASILVGIGLCIAFVKNEIIKSWFLRMVVFSSLILAAIFSISMSILISIIIFIFWFFISKKYSITSIFSIIVVPVFIILGSSTIFLVSEGISPLEYLNVVFGKISIDSDWILGKGPVIFSGDFQLIPDNYTTDVGIFRIMQESGIINMLIVLTFIYLAISKALKKIRTDDSQVSLIFLVLFSLCLTSIHTNYIIVPPFSILFAISAGWIFSKST